MRNIRQPVLLVSEVAPGVFVEWTRDRRGQPHLRTLLPPGGAGAATGLTRLSPAERLALDARVTALYPDRTRWHVSLVPARHPTVVAWYGRPHDPHPEPVSRVWDAEGQPAIWVAGTTAQAIQVAQTALLSRGIPAAVSPLPPALARTLAWLAPPLAR